jgi:hypothetical protein
MSRSQWGRLGRCEDPHPDLAELCCAGRALGLQLGSKFYPIGVAGPRSSPLALLGRFERELALPLRMRREVPLPIRGDLRVWDAIVEGGGAFFVEGETRVGDAQLLERRIRLKQRDDPRASTIVLVLGRSAYHRAFLERHREILRDLLPLDGPPILCAVRQERRPAASGIVVI